MKHIKAVLFDVDGVLVNSQIFSEQYAKDYDVELSEMAKFFKNEFQDCLIGTKDLKEELPAYLKQWKWDKSVDEFLDYWFTYKYRVDPEIAEYARSLKENGYHIYLATNNERYRTDYLLQSMGLKDIFPKAYASGYVGFKKPDYAFFEYIHNDLEGTIQKEEILFWDDDPHNVEGARKYGIYAEQYIDFAQFVSTMETYLT